MTKVEPRFVCYSGSDFFPQAFNIGIFFLKGGEFQKQN